MHEPETTPLTTAVDPAPAQPARPFFDLRVWARDLLVSVFLAGVFVIFLYQPVKVEGTSMMPLLLDQERIFINKYVYRFGEIDRGDIVVFWYPLDTGKSYVKRVVGLPGDTVKISGGKVYVNSEPLMEPYVLPEYFDYQSYPKTTIGPDAYFVLGDHRNSSSDSRSWGPVHRRYIYGRAALVYWPLARLGRVQ